MQFVYLPKLSLSREGHPATVTIATAAAALVLFVASMKGSSYPDGRFADLNAVIDHDSRVFNSTLGAESAAVRSNT